MVQYSRATRLIDTAITHTMPRSLDDFRCRMLRCDSASGEGSDS